MPKVTVVQVVFNSKRYMERVFSALFSQTFRDFNVVAVIAGNDDGGKEFLAERFPQVEIIDPGYNVGFAKGHNLVFEKCESEFFQLLNPDLILTPTYIENMLKAFDDPKVAAATGKLLLYDFDKDQRTNIIDTTGQVMAKTGRSRDRGQYEEDEGQYDNQRNIFGVSGAGAMLRGSALEVVKLPHTLSAFGGTRASPPEGEKYNEASLEAFDESFHSYWEDTDLSWRFLWAGYENRYVPEAVAYHGRGMRPVESGKKSIFAYARHHRKIPARLRKRAYANYVYTFIKNTPRWYTTFFVRQGIAFVYMVLFEPNVLTVYGTIFKNVRSYFRKRKLIQKFRKISVEEMEQVLGYSQ